MTMLWVNQRIIYKYPLIPKTGGMGNPLNGVVEMPAGARIVLVGHQDHVPTIWAEVSLERGMQRRVFQIYGTGMKVDDNDVWVGSYQDDWYVWHVYESNP